MIELTDLDRCEHGRHAVDICGDCGRQSHGNPHKGAVIGFDVHAKPYTAVDLFEEIVKLRVSLHVHHTEPDNTCLYCTSAHINSQIEVVTPCPNCSHPLDLHDPTCPECDCVDDPNGFTNSNSHEGNE